MAIAAESGRRSFGRVGYRPSYHWRMIARTRLCRPIHRIEIAHGAIRLSVAIAEFAFVTRTAFQSALAR